VLGVPLITPVAVSSVNPAGREVEDHVRVPVPPETVGGVVERWVPTSSVYEAVVGLAEGLAVTAI
jgi:hypothetical protein